MKKEVIKSDHEKILAKYEPGNKQLLDRLNAIEVKTKTDVEVLSDGAVMINLRLSEIEAERKKVTAPLNESLKAANNLFKRIAAPLEEMKRIVQAKMQKWWNDENVKRQEEEDRIKAEEERRRKIQAAHKKQGHDVAEPIELEKPAPVETKVGNTHVRKDWTFEVIDEIKVPREYLMVDDGKISVRISQGIRDIPGLRIYQKETLVTSSRGW
jgi:hypothetical protein